MSKGLIVGIDMIPFRRYPDRTVEQLGGEAALLALADAGLSIRDVQALYCGCSLQANSMVGQRILRQIGEHGMPVLNVTNGCATGASAFREAVLAVESGRHDVALAVGVEQMARGLIEMPGRPTGFREEGAIGTITTPSMFAQAGLVHSAQYGTTFEQFAKVAVKNHHHAILNDKAYVRRETPLEEVMASDMIAYPNTKLMCSINIDGAAAAVVCSEAYARKHGLMGRAVRVRTAASLSSVYTDIEDGLTDFSEVTRATAKLAYESAGIDVKDIDLVELHDCFATAELLHYENLALCGLGEAGALIDSGETAHGGRIPVNVSGGLLSKGHPLGATGIANLYELCLHLRDEAGARQVEGARIGLAHIVGGIIDYGSACAVHVLERA
ncbi:thiolase family protein [Sphingopyxis sp. MSC1_008]|jgi:acetyl-CoA acyltransferase|uniref:thiolase family protein n=1 Tax=Sphingopyxis sp. MSC1_008 TaxID=2909265 RepID=UPI0020C0C48D|nr:thiolase family protein [Sphingopyxis sp. MSC1_008]